MYQLGDCLPADKAQALMKALDYFEAQHSDMSSRRSAILSPGKGRLGGLVRERKARQMQAALSPNVFK